MSTVTTHVPSDRSVEAGPADLPPPIDVSKLARVTHSVLATAAGTMRTRRAARPLAGDPDGYQARVVALMDGEHLQDQRCCGGASLQVLHGRAVIDTSGHRELLGQGSWVAVPPGPHHVEAVGDTALLITTLPATADGQPPRRGDDG